MGAGEVAAGAAAAGAVAGGEEAACQGDALHVLLTRLITLIIIIVILTCPNVQFLMPIILLHTPD